MKLKEGMEQGDVEQGTGTEVNPESWTQLDARDARVRRCQGSVASALIDTISILELYL